MKPSAGLWMDHREAIIVLLSETGERTKRIRSAVEKQLRSGKPGNGQVHPDDLRQREFTEHLSRYYEEIISYLRDAGSILIFGPGEAKGELKKRFETHKSDARAIAMETTDNMTEPQVVAKVRQHFMRPSCR